MWHIARNGGFDRALAEMAAAQQDFENLFSNLEGRSSAFLGWGSAPEARLTDDGANLVLEAVVPGLQAEDIDLQATATGITVSGERKVTAPEGYKVHRQERIPYRFSRSFRLPIRINPEAVSAEVKGGILTVRLPKAPEVQPRKITIS